LLSSPLLTSLLTRARARLDVDAEAKAAWRGAFERSGWGRVTVAGREITLNQAKALTWLQEHNGDGVFDRNGILLAAGELAPHRRQTWNALERAGLVEFYGKHVDGTGRGRCRVTNAVREPKGARRGLWR
jgi:hypothetical protein